MKLPTAAPRTIALIAGLILLAFLTFYIPSCLQKRRAAADQNRVTIGQTTASTDTGVVAINTVETVTAKGAETDAIVAEGKTAVRAAPEAQRGQVAINSACRMRTYRDTPACKGAAK